MPAFAYGTALWFDFLSERHDAELVVEFLDALLDDANAESPEFVFEDLLAQRGDDLETAWAMFARYNLATGRRAGVAESHPYAGGLGGIDPDASGDVIALDARFYPLAASYYNLQHAGGDAWFVADDALTNVAFSLHPVGDFASDGAVGDAIATWSVDTPSAQRVYEDLPPGGYWVVGTLPVIADGPARANLCVSNDPAALGCPDVPDGGGSTTSSGDESSSGEGTTGDAMSETSGTGTHEEDDSSTGGDAAKLDAATSGCGCNNASPPGWFYLPSRG